MLMNKIALWISNYGNDWTAESAMISSYEYTNSNWALVFALSFEILFFSAWYSSFPLINSVESTKSTKFVEHFL